ncbi:hypothetical protein A2U01_0093655, partial [Trifolium medium]|nr:hypothetical protein [Trifolium medium]
MSKPLSMISFIRHVLFGTPYPPYGQIDNPQTFVDDPLSWSRPLVKHHCGQFSMA